MIALALLGNPRLLLADEPTTALDALTEQAILSLLERLCREMGMTLLFITHDLHVLKRITTRSFVLRDGRLKHQGATEEILALPGAGLLDEVPPNQPKNEAGTLPTAAIVLQACQLSVAYRSSRSWPWSPVAEKWALHPLDLQVVAGEWVALIGPSGCGKTSLARCLAGLLPPKTGTFTLMGGSAQLIFQDPNSSLNPRHTVRTILAEVLRYQPSSTATVEDLLEQVALPAATFAGRYPAQLSGGQRQRVAIARALAARPALLIADEAVSALDMPLRAGILALLQKLCRKNGIGILFVSHDLRLVRAWADRVLIMQEGRIVEQGPTEEVFTHPRSILARRLLQDLDN